MCVCVFCCRGAKSGLLCSVSGPAAPPPVCLSARLHQWVEDLCILIGQLLNGINVTCVRVMMMKSFLCAADCLQTDFQWTSLK